MGKKKKAAADSGDSYNKKAARKDTDTVAGGMLDWNQDFHNWAGGAIDYAQGNPYQGYADAYIGNMLGGGMGANPWMSNLYNNVGHVNMDPAMGMLEDFLGYGSGAGGKSPGGSNPRPGRPTSSGGGKGGGGGGWVPAGQGGFGGGGGGGYHGGGGGGSIPDTYDEGTKFGQQAKYFFDEARLDPANDPTLAPMIDAIQREAEESYYKSLQNLHANMEGAGQFGGGLYRAMMGSANEEYNEAIQGTIATQYAQARQAALEHKQNALNMLNQRDIAGGQIAAQEAAASAAAAGQADAIAAQMQMHNQEMQLQGIGMMLQAGQFGLGLQGDMAGLMQQGQLGALQAGMGYGQLGMSGYDAAANFGQLGLGALQGAGNMYNQYWNTAAQDDAARRAAALQQQQMDFTKQRYQDQLPWQQMGSMIDVMRGLGDLSGNYLTPSYTPGMAPFTGMDPTSAMLLGGFGGFMGGANMGGKMF